MAICHLVYGQIKVVFLFQVLFSMKTKEQKKEAIDEARELLGQSNNLSFVDFTGVSVGDIQTLRRKLMPIGAKLKVIKKKLLRIVLEKSNIDLNPEQFDAQLGTIFSTADINEVIPPIFKFFKEKEKKGFKILGAYDLDNKKFMDAELVKRIGQLPSREILLAQLLGMLSAPIRMFMYVLDQKSKL